MALHLIKLCVGVKSPAQLLQLQKEKILRQTKRGEEPALFHITRMMPKRREALIKGGSLYWVFSGFIAARQTLLDIKPIEGEDKRRCCRLDLSLELILTERIPRRPFQGWRYLEGAGAPPDLKGGALGEAWGEEMPPDMRRALGEIGVL